MIHFTPKVFKAVKFATDLHRNQLRKADGLPYIHHPYSVALILLEYTQNEDIIIAGLLHDIIEDTTFTEEEMRKEFGQNVTQFVLGVTEPPKEEASWQERKNAYLETIKNASFESKLICAADKLHNMRSMLEAIQEFGEKAHEKFNAPADKKYWFYEECLKIIKTEERIPKELIEEIEEVLLLLKKF